MIQSDSRAVLGRSSRLAGLAPRFLCVLLLAVTVPARGQVLPLGSDFQINSLTSGDQSNPVIAAQATGSFVVAWEDDGNDRIAARRMDANGLPLTDEVALSEATHQEPTDLAADENGDLMVVWGYGIPGPHGGFPADVEAHGLDEDLTPAGAQFVVSEFGSYNYDVGPGAIARRGAGEFVIVWREQGIQARRYALNGDPQGPAIEVSSVGYSPSVAASPEGGFVASWREYNSGAPDYQRAKRFDAAGNPVGGVITIAEGSDVDVGNIGGVELASHSSGSFVAAWHVWTSEMRQVRARRFAPDGSSLGPSFRVDPDDAGFSTFGGVAIGADGSFVIGWQQSASPGGACDTCELLARRYSSDGTPLGSTFQLNGATAGPQGGSRLEFLPNGDLVATWTSSVSSGGDTSGTSIQARLFRLPFFIDGFETGDTSRWSSSS